MLDGTSPVIIIQYYTTLTKPTQTTQDVIKEERLQKSQTTTIQNKNTISLDDWKLYLTKTPWKNLKKGLPIPITLSEKFGFIYVSENETYNNSLEYVYDTKYNYKRQSSLNITLQYNRNNFFANVFANILATLWENADVGNVIVSYFNTTSFLTNGSLGSFTKEINNKNDLGTINLSLDRGDKEINKIIDKNNSSNSRTKGIDKYNPNDGTNIGIVRVIKTIK